MTDNQKHVLLGACCGLAGFMLYRAASRYSFAGKTVLITGGSRGLGLVLARAFARQGARLALLARNNNELKTVRDEFAASGVAPLTLACDVTQPADVQAAVERVTSEVGAIDVVVNNAGIIQVGPLSRMTRAEFEGALATNFWSAYNVIEAVLPQMRGRGAGRIVNISSIGGKIAVPHMLPYSVSKFALVGYSNGLRAELANNGIAVTTVCPGLMRTGSARNATFKGQHEKEYAWFKISSSLPLLTISAENAATQILRACSAGRAEVVLSMPANLAVLAHHLFPEWTANLISLANRLMPRPADSDFETDEGRNCETGLTRSFLTALTDEAAIRNNELFGSE